MTEQEYINISELKVINSALEILRDIVPANSIVIDKKKWVDCILYLQKCRDKLRKVIKIRGE